MIPNLLIALGAEVAGGRESYPTNYVLNKHIYARFLMIFLSILFLFFHFLVLHWS